MLPLFGKAGVVHDPVAHRSVPLDGGQHLLAHRPEQGRVVPFRLGHEVVQGLVRRLHPGRRDPGGHRLDALALARQQQPGAVGLRCCDPACMAQHRHDRVQIGGEPLLAGERPLGPFLLPGHAPFVGCLGPNDTVRLEGVHGSGLIHCGDLTRDRWFSRAIVPSCEAGTTSNSMPIGRSLHPQPAKGPGTSANGQP